MYFITLISTGKNNYNAVICQEQLENATKHESQKFTVVNCNYMKLHVLKLCEIGHMDLITLDLV